MKAIRQSKLLEIINKENIDTQEDLQKALEKAGFSVTQATVSRDIRELGIIKSISHDGIYKYHVQSNENERNKRFEAMFRQAVISVEPAGNIIVVKTHAGMGNAAGAAADALEFEGVVGTLAGDDTLLIITHDASGAEYISSSLRKMIG